MPTAGFEPASERPQTYALDRVATRIKKIGHIKAKTLFKWLILRLFQKLGSQRVVILSGKYFSFSAAIILRELNTLIGSARQP